MWGFDGVVLGISRKVVSIGTGNLIPKWTQNLLMRQNPHTHKLAATFSVGNDTHLSVNTDLFGGLQILFIWAYQR